MDTEPTYPLEVLVQSVTKQQQTRSDLVNRLNYLTSQVFRYDAEIESLSTEDKSLREALASIIKSNVYLEERTVAVIQNRDIEHQSRSSLALTLESLNEKSRSLEDFVNREAATTSSALKEIQDKLDVDIKFVADLLADQGAIHLTQLIIRSCS